MFRWRRYSNFYRTDMGLLRSFLSLAVGVYAGIYIDQNYQSEVEETLKRIQSHKGVQGVIVINSEGIPIRTTLDNSTTVQYASLLSSLAAQARNCVRDTDPQNDLTFLRVRSKKHEILVAPDKDYMLIVIQNPAE